MAQMVVLEVEVPVGFPVVELVEPQLLVKEIMVEPDQQMATLVLVVVEPEQ